MSSAHRTFIMHLLDEPGALERVVGALRKRSLNIASLTVAPTRTSGRSRLTLVAEAERAPRLAQTFRKVVPVLDAEDVTLRPTVAREVALLRVRSGGEAELRRIAELVVCLGGRVVAGGAESTIVEIAGPSAAVDRLIAALDAFGLLELARSGPVAMLHGDVAAPAEGERDDYP
jgi:acetolactate synthase-1/3 small subunit